MTTKFKLVVSDRVEFDVKFSLNDAGDDKRFGMRLSAQRQSLQDHEREIGEQVNVEQFLAARNVTMLSWLGKPALQDEAGEPVPAGKEALTALCSLVGGMGQLVFASYLQANGARGRSGN